jgi:hypothetical protein
MSKRIVTLPPERPEERLLESLERQIIMGQRALDRRNEMVVQLHGNGWSKASLFHRLNRVREEMGAEPLTRSAIDVTVRRSDRIMARKTDRQILRDSLPQD